MGNTTLILFILIMLAFMTRGRSILSDRSESIGYTNDSRLLSKKIRFSKEENQDQCLEIKTKIRLSDQQLADILKKNREYQHLESYEKSKRNQLIRQIHGETGSSIRQLSRVLGLGKMIIEQALRERT
jgi:K+/H+ antiporter YhaU regulatory subunit KhtT